MKLTERSVIDFLARVQAPEPAPGGGSASALAGALGASLLTMIGSMPKHTAQTATDEQRLRQAGATCRRVAGSLTALIDEDSDSYERVMTAYRLPKSTEVEKAARSGRIQAALRGATESPLAIMRLSLEAVDEARHVAAFGNPNAASDVGVALELLSAALNGARLNVEINLEHVKDAGYAASIREEVTRLRRECDSAAARARATLA